MKVYNTVELYAGVGRTWEGFRSWNRAKLGLLVDNDPFAADTYKANFPDAPYLKRNLRWMKPSELETLAGGKIDILLGCPPCQGFSDTGKRDPADPRNNHITLYGRYIEALMPSAVVMENVPLMAESPLFIRITSMVLNQRLARFCRQTTPKTIQEMQTYPGQHPAIIDQTLWDQVQLKFQSNLQAARKRPRATEQSLLIGLLYDEQGNRFTPSHATKKGRRYRYYVSQVVIKKSTSNLAGPARIPAPEVEELVLSQLTLLLRSPQRMMDILVDVDGSPGDIKAITEASRVWSTATGDKVQTLLQSTVKRVIVHNERIEIEVNKAALRQTVLGVPEDPVLPANNPGDLVTIEATAQLKRCGGEVRLLLPPDSPGAKPHSVPSLIRAISRAHDWVDRILRGEAVNQRSIAKETGLDERYVSRVITLAFLAPDLTEAILEGKQSAHLSLDTCLENIPDDWNKQRTQLLSQ